MTDFFGKLRNAPSTYLDDNDGALSDVRLVIYRFGEDPQTVIQTFFEEHRGHANFAIIPLPAYGLPPRKELCTQKSLVSALQVAVVEPNSVQEQSWKSCCELHSVSWPKRLTAAA